MTPKQHRLIKLAMLSESTARPRKVIAGATARGRGRLSIQKSNQRLDTYETETRRFLSRYMEDFVKSKKTPFELQQEYGDDILEFLLHETTKTYLLGFKYVETVVGIRPDLNAEHEMNIRIMARAIYDSFWKAIKRGREERIRGASVFDLIGSLVRLLMNTAVNDGTLAAARVTYQQVLGTDEFEPEFEFVTMRDERVDCRICAPLDGLKMRPTDTFFAKPPLHINCRCRLRLILGQLTVSSQRELLFDIESQDRLIL